jgi:hypothetical protein
MRLAAATLILASAVLAAADPPALSAKPVQLTTGAVLPADLPFDAKPFAHEAGFKIWWLVQASDLIGFDEDSVVMNALKSADGKDLATTRNGKPTWKLDSFPKVSDDGKYGVFSIECSADVFGKTDRLSMSGTLVALTGSDRKEADLAFDPAKPSNVDAGPLKIAFGAKGMRFGGAAETYGIQVSGPLVAIASIEVRDGDAKLESQGWSGSGATRTYNFAMPKTATPKLKLSYWGTSARVKVEFTR